MAYTLIKGEFVIRYDDLPNQGPEPDGDTIKFKPDNDDLVLRLRRISGRPPRLTERGINVRLEAIDALETHFQVGSTKTHQELKGGEAARDRLLASLGFEDVVFIPGTQKIESANHDSLRGYVLSNGIDANGRMIAFVLPDGNATLNALADGAKITRLIEPVDESSNTKLLTEGLVYPAFYGTLPENLRDHLTEKSQAARAAKKGIWPRATASPNKAATVTDLDQLQTLVIWPKLFRRLAAYLEEGNDGLGGFIEWLQEDRVKRDDTILRLDTGEKVKFHEVLTVRNNTIKMAVQPEELVVEPDPAPRAVDN